MLENVWLVSDGASVNLESDFFLIQVLHILTENLQPPGTITFGVTGNQPAKI